MARKVERETHETAAAAERTGGSSLPRRGYLTLGATAIAGLFGFAGGATTVGATDDQPYETIELDPGEQRSYTISDGERFENVLIDQTAPGSMFSLLVEEGANDWVIRNVGWKGLAPTGGGNREYTFLIHVRGDGRIENVFIDQRNHDEGEGSDVGGIWTYPDTHHGHIDCRHNFIAGCGNNASYTSGDGWAHYASTGTVSHFRSYHRDNTVSNFRPGRPGCTVRECVSVVNDPDGTRGSYPTTDSQMSRAMWAWHNPDIRMEDCAIWHDPDDVQATAPFWATWHGQDSDGSFAELTVTNCAINSSWEAAGHDLVLDQYGGSGNDDRRVTIEGLSYDPTVDILGDGVPTTAEMAAAGERTLPPALGSAPSAGHGDFREDQTSQQVARTYADVDGVHTELPYEFIVEPDEAGEQVAFEVTIDGTVERGELADETAVTGNEARGHVGPDGGIENLYFDGDIIDLSVDNEDDAVYYLADAQEREIIERIDPASYRGTDSTGANGRRQTENAVEFNEYGGEVQNTNEVHMTGTTDDTDGTGNPAMRRASLFGAIGSLGAAGYVFKRHLGGEDE